MDPLVDDGLVTTQFFPVRSPHKIMFTPGDESVEALGDSEEEDIYNSIEVHVKRGQRYLYFLNRHSLEACEHCDSSTFTMDRDAVSDVLNNPGGGAGG